MLQLGRNAASAAALVPGLWGMARHASKAASQGKADVTQLSVKQDWAAVAKEMPAGTVEDIPTTNSLGQAFGGDIRSTSGLGMGDGIRNHTEKWLQVCRRQRPGSEVLLHNHMCTETLWCAVWQALQQHKPAAKAQQAPAATAAHGSRAPYTGTTTPCIATLCCALPSSSSVAGISSPLPCCMCRATSSPPWTTSRPQSPSRCPAQWWHHMEVSDARCCSHQTCLPRLLL
jgi:hypothetical protein